MVSLTRRGLYGIEWVGAEMRDKIAPHTPAKTRGTAAPKDDFIRDVVARVAVTLATTPEGRAAGLSVEVWPGQDVALRVRRGHELRIFVEDSDGIEHVGWQRTDPGASSGRARTSRGSLGKRRMMSARDIQGLMVRWLTWRARG